MKKQVVKYDWENAKQVAQLSCDTKAMFHPFDASWFNDIKKHKFEDLEINLPIGAEKYLNQYFGDFMQLPPEESRHPVHNTKLIDLMKPYKYYKGIYYCVDKYRR